VQNTDFLHVLPKAGLSFRRCPKAWLRDDSLDSINLMRDYRWLRDHNILPRAGGKMDQDARYVDAVDIMAEEDRIHGAHG
jgi:hypothetical protein